MRTLGGPLRERRRRAGRARTAESGTASGAWAGVMLSLGGPVRERRRRAGRARTAESGTASGAWAE